MPPLLTVNQFRDVATVDVPDHVLQDLIDEASEVIVGRFGPHPILGQTIVRTLQGGAPQIFLSTPIDIAATPAPVITEDGTLLTSDDYTVEFEGRAITRWEANKWGAVVIVTYVPVNNRMQRKQAAIALVKLGLTFSGYQVERLGDVSLTPESYARVRREILRSLSSSMVMA